MLCSGNGLLSAELKMGGEIRYRRKTPLTISGTQTQVFADSVTISASELNCCTIVCVYYLISVTAHVIVVKADFAHFACNESGGRRETRHFNCRQSVQNQL